MTICTVVNREEIPKRELVRISLDVMRNKPWCGSLSRHHDGILFGSGHLPFRTDVLESGVSTPLSGIESVCVVEDDVDNAMREIGSAGAV